MKECIEVPAAGNDGVPVMDKLRCHPDATRRCEHDPSLPQPDDAPCELFRFRASLSQWRAFHAVIACGGYAGAAKYLHVTQPAISYSITKLEQQFGVRLLKLNGRKAYITSAGQALLPRSHELLRLAADLERMASSLRANGSRGAPSEPDRAMREAARALPA